MRAVWIDEYEQISCVGIGSSSLLFQETDAAYWSKHYPYAAITNDFDFNKVMQCTDTPEIRQMDQLTKYSVASAALLLKKTSREIDAFSRERTGIIVGSAFGCTASNQTYLDTLLSFGPRKTSPIVFRNNVSNAMAGHLAITFGLTGPNTVLNSGMLAGLQALTYAFDEIDNGNCDFILSGSSDRVSELIRRRFMLQGEKLGHGPLPLMDGACMMTLRSGQTMDALKWRVAGYGLGFLPTDDIGPTFIRILQKALDRAHINSIDIDIAQFHSDCNEFWVRTDSDSLEKASLKILLKIKHPFQENTSIPVMLSLMSTLISMPEKKIPGLFVRKRACNHLKKIPRYILFAGIGNDGDVVILILNHST